MVVLHPQLAALAGDPMPHAAADEVVPVPGSGCRAGAARGRLRAEFLMGGPRCPSFLERERAFGLPPSRQNHPAAPPTRPESWVYV
jgi:hypothetical protein